MSDEVTLESISPSKGEGTSQAPARPPAEDRYRILEAILAQLERRTDEENERHKTADSKLTSAIAVTPIIATLTTSAFFALLNATKQFGPLEPLYLSVFTLALLCFIISAFIAGRGLNPKKSTYATIGLKTLTNFISSGIYTDFLEKMINERTEALRLNKQINGRKLGLYARASTVTSVGLSLLLTIVVLSTSLSIIEPIAAAIRKP